GRSSPGFGPGFAVNKIHSPPGVIVGGGPQKACNGAQDLGISRGMEGGEVVTAIFSPPQLCQELEKSVLARTGRRVRQLAIELSPERVVLRGVAVSYHVKQLAQHGIRDLLPRVRLENAIVVEGTN